MSDSTILARYAERVAEERSDLDSRLQGEPWDDLGAFGWLRGVRERAVMLELRRKTGSVLAVGYGWLEKAEFDPSEGITLYIVGQKISLRGRNLNVEVRPLVRLFEGLTRHRVPWIRESGQADILAARSDTCLIESIDW